MADSLNPDKIMNYRHLAKIILPVILEDKFSGIDSLFNRPGIHCGSCETWFSLRILSRILSASSGRMVALLPLIQIHGSADALSGVAFEPWRPAKIHGGGFRMK